MQRNYRGILFRIRGRWRISMLEYSMKCGECGSAIENDCTYKRSDFNMFTRKPMSTVWYICINENCGVNLPLDVI